jgi:non-ribosomal peptide synthetase component E (peptide arylation enzyme)
MVPSHITVMDTMPMTSNGKVDKQALENGDLGRLTPPLGGFL